VAVHAMHPGWADTPGVASSLPAFHKVTRKVLRTPAEGADAIVWLAASEQAGRSTGRFWLDRQPRTTHVFPGTRETPRSASGSGPPSTRSAWASSGAGVWSTPGSG
jgi:dehydrogenase/reductase SDR family member 12